ncbi:hypothetical protein VTI74DRAFT_3941 [Chaetomium olivicolor]
MEKEIRLGSRLRYPITIVKLLKAPGDKIKKQEPLLQYSFKWMKEVGDTIRGDTWEEEQTTIVTWESPTDGELTQWRIREGQRVTADTGCMVVKEECSHDIQYGGLCAMCGKDMTEVSWAAETRDTERATISMVHDHTGLLVSEDQAQRTEEELQRRLLECRKLSLVVDLDQTIIQACIDPTVGEWQNDPSNPNHESVKEVKVFQLDDGPSVLARRCSYYIKMRPGLEGFLKRISDMYELHVYTMGTRAYAQNVARVVDPDKRLFGNRVISRDENGNMYAKSLQRLFPVSTHMVVIIDDRSDVWPRNRPNLIKVSPYEFFKGIGDINSSFLPKRQDLLTSDAAASGVKKETKKKKTERDDAAAMEAIVNMTGGDDSALTKRQLEEQERVLEKQIKDRPLQLLQEKLDREDDEAEKASEDGSESRSSSPGPQRHRVLTDDDAELQYLEQHLTNLHKAYYAEYDRTAAVPDVGQVLDRMKSQVLKGCKIVLSGVLPRGIDIYKSEIGLQITSFGAELRSTVRSDVTHLVVNAAQPGREKLLEARRRPHIKIVSQEWLADCFSRWEKVEEGPYLFTARLVEEGNGKKVEQEEVVSDEDEDETPAKREVEIGKLPNGKPKPPKLKLVPVSGTSKEVDVDQDESDDDDDENAANEDEDEEMDEDFEPDLLPDDLPDGQMSPIDGLKTFNWGSADQELEDFLNESDDDDEGLIEGDEDEEDDEKNEEDTQPEGGDVELDDSKSRSKTPPRTLKRKSRDEEVDSDDEGNEVGAEGGETPAKKLRRTQSQHGSSLRNQYVASEGGSGLPTPGGTDEQDGEAKAEVREENGKEEDDDDMEFDEAALEAEFEAEFEKLAKEEGLGVGWDEEGLEMGMGEEKG